MRRDAAFALSDDLVRHGFNHTVQVGIHRRMNPPEQYRVDVVARSGGYSASDLGLLAEIAENNGLLFKWGGLLHNGITFESTNSHSESA